MKVLIVGAGIGGLALGAHLKRAGHKVVIVEKADKLKKVGFVLGLWGAGLKTLKEFGLEDKLRKVGYSPTRFDLRSKKGKVLRHFNFSKFVYMYGKAVIILRSDFHQILLDLNKGNTIELDTSIEKIEEKNNGVVATLTNGRKEMCDLIVGADGIHSKVRGLLFGDGYVKYSGLTSWIFMTDQVSHFRPNVTEVWSGNAFFGVYPFKFKRFCAIFALKRKQGELDNVSGKELLVKNFAEFGWLGRETLGGLQSDSQLFRTDWNEVYIKDWVKGRAVLIGDAAHAMLPTAGSGASMALEDAYWLALELQANPDDLPAALRAFTARRRPVVDALRSHTDFLGSIIKLSGPLGIVRNLLIRIVPSAWVIRDLRHLMTIQSRDVGGDYIFTTMWTFDAPITEVKRVFMNIEAWPDWWVTVQKVEATERQNKHTTLRLVLGLWLYRLDLNIREEVITENEIEGIATGDLFGTAKIYFVQRGATTKVVIRWTVFVEKPWVRAASRLFHPVFSLLHNAAMSSGAKGMAKQLHCRLISSKTMNYTRIFQGQSLENEK